MGVRDVVREGLRRAQVEGQGQAPDAGERLDAGPVFGVEGTHGHSHELGRYVVRYGGCLLFSG
ncbi:hypothetical protein STRTUCAR8_07433, partial [Streptomyces turgidiscabies Car8]